MWDLWIFCSVTVKAKGMAQWYSNPECRRGNGVHACLSVCLSVCKSPDMVAGNWVLCVTKYNFSRSMKYLTFVLVCMCY